MLGVGSLDVSKKRGSGIVQRYPSGKKKKEHGQPRALWRRLADNEAAVVRMGGNPNWSHKLGLYLLHKTLTQAEYQAGQIYGRIAGRYRRFHSDSDLPITAPSPSYQRGSRGRDDELDRRKVDGTLDDYVKDAKKALKAWKKLQSCIPTEHARTIVEEVCIYDHEVPEAALKTLKNVLNAIAGRFGGARKG